MSKYIYYVYTFRITADGKLHLVNDKISNGNTSNFEPAAIFWKKWTKMKKNLFIIFSYRIKVQNEGKFFGGYLLNLNFLKITDQLGNLPPPLLSYLPSSKNGATLQKDVSKRNQLTV